MCSYICGGCLPHRGLAERPLLPTTQQSGAAAWSTQRKGSYCLLLTIQPAVQSIFSFNESIQFCSGETYSINVGFMLFLLTANGKKKKSASVLVPIHLDLLLFPLVSSDWKLSWHTNILLSFNQNDWKNVAQKPAVISPCTLDLRETVFHCVWQKCLLKWQEAQTAEAHTLLYLLVRTKWAVCWIHRLTIRHLEPLRRWYTRPIHRTSQTCLIRKHSSESSGDE